MWPGDASGCEDSRSGRSRVLCRGRVRRGEDGLGRKKRRSLFENPKIDGPQPPNRSSMAATVCDSRISPDARNFLSPLFTVLSFQSLPPPMRRLMGEPGESDCGPTIEQTALLLQIPQSVAPAGSTGRVVRRIGNERVHDAGEGRCWAHGDGTDTAHQHPQPHRAEGEGAHPTDAPNDDNPTAPRTKCTPLTPEVCPLEQTHRSSSRSPSSA